MLQPGQQSTIMLRDAGLYYYYCGAHAALTAQGRAAANSSVRPSPLPMDGTASVTFHSPGPYDYYGTGVAALDPVWQRASARLGAAGHPMPLEGVIAILDY